MRRVETHDEVIARIWQEIQAKEVAEIEAQYAPRPKVVPALQKAAPDPWVLVDADTYEQSIAPTATGLRIHGLATTPTVTSSRRASSSADMKAVLPLPLWSEHKDAGSQPIGEVYFLRKSPRGVYMRAALFDHFAAKYAENLIRRRELGCLSIAHKPGSKLLAEVDDIKFFSEWTLKEISVCRLGRNPDCKFEVLQDGDEGKKFWEPSDSAGDRPSLPYRGVWKATETYRPGDFVTKAGGLWHSEISSTGLEPGLGLGWKLCVKSGEAHKLETTQARRSNDTPDIKNEAPPPPAPAPPPPPPLAPPPLPTPPRRRKERTTVTAYTKDGRIKEFVKEEIE
ncbi:hypothetical protein NKI94_07050 [Mesorhizobium australicum]|uniref:hypothetical protein n=1 Tax=Mesorhizobium australicum TaxID=536018 RepID=UPI00333735DE